jgi:hypothetical protein
MDHPSGKAGRDAPDRGDIQLFEYNPDAAASPKMHCWRRW